MNSTERIKSTFNFVKTDHLVRSEFGFFAETLRKWRKEGLDEKFAENPFAEGNPFHYDDDPFINAVRLGWGEPPFWPYFEEKTIKTDGDYVILQDKFGRVLKKLVVGGSEYVMPHTISNPVKNRDDWEKEVKPRLDWTSSERWKELEENSGHWNKKIKDGDRLCCVRGIGAFMYLKELLGVNDSYYVYYDDPELVRDLMRRWLEFMLNSVKRVQSKMPIFRMFFCEDSCYNKGPFLSPGMMSEFLIPYYKELIQQIQDGSKEKMFFEIDSDGNVEEVIKLYQHAGINAMSPFEVQCGGDVVKYGAKYPELVIRGGIDKKILAGTKDDIDRELERIVPFVMKRGGYIPCCDHMVPPEVSLENYLYYREKIVKLDH